MDTTAVGQFSGVDCLFWALPQLRHVTKQRLQCRIFIPARLTSVCGSFVLVVVVPLVSVSLNITQHPPPPI